MLNYRLLCFLCLKMGTSIFFNYNILKIYFLNLYFILQIVDIVCANVHWDWEDFLPNLRNLEHPTKTFFKKLLGKFRPDTPHVIHEIFKRSTACNHKYRQNISNVKIIFYLSFYLLI